MLKAIYSIALEKNNFSNKKTDKNIVDQKNSSRSIFDQFKKYLMSKEIEFDNVVTEEKKDDNTSIVYANFVINNLLNILNKKDIYFNTNLIQDKITEKKIEKYNSIISDSNNLLKSIKKNQKQEKYTILKKESLSTEILQKKNKNHFFLVNKFIAVNKVNNVFLKKNHDPFVQKKENFSINIKNNIPFLKNERKIIFLKDTKNHKNTFHASKITNKTHNAINQKVSSKEINKKEGMKLYTDPLMLHDSNNSIEWKNLINKKILLSIFNKKNQVEMYLKPEYLGNIHIKIKMKHNQVQLNFISNHNEVRIFLENYIPFLRNSLKKNGIELKKFTICSSLKNKELNNCENLLYKRFSKIDEFKKNLNVHEHHLERIKYKSIDVYV
ncbi:flagellar hook-length control protein FliK [Buchnera aphidicola (Hyperomyzus lactucae)]|uniref:Flagellar hook-length control protein FliK n=1 Tax=Buchnera aphidicola (Hyperomyzus lactucae) TaxID=1241860 RepID=A0A4D6Y4B3_9GAMM|nr:flagellar hook-length control protein FliK [Buchnera aphidicola]QCI20821.1 flagellar hook-length control protein FliK [Buchnera aphidicola (Hyperomyzus lactucae)]